MSLSIHIGVDRSYQPRKRKNNALNPYEMNNKKNICCIFLYTAFIFFIAQNTFAQMLISKVKSWGYWLQAPDIQVISKSPYDLMVIDYSFDGTDRRAITSQDLEKLHKANKHVLCYLSIGEAESYRFYWKKQWKPGNPQFLEKENPDWEGNYKVKYWDNQWWETAIKPYLNRILSANFDGVYLDIIDAYYYWSQNNYPLKKCANQMIDLVCKIRSYVEHQGKSHFTICPQNGLSIIQDASLLARKRYLNAINAIGVESLFFNYWSIEDQTYRLHCLKQFHLAKKQIFNIEYIKPDQWLTYQNYRLKQNIPIIGYAAHEDRGLKELIIFKPE